MARTDLDDVRTRVSVEASAVGDADHVRRAFVVGLLAALAAGDGFDAVAWSMRRLRARGLPPTLTVHRRPAAAVARALAAVRVAPRATWVAPRSGVIHLASGPVHVRLAAPGVVTVHDTDLLTGPDRASIARVEALRRGADRGAIVHGVTTEICEALGSLGVAHDRIVVAPPGLTSVEETTTSAQGAVAVLADVPSALDDELVARLSASGVTFASLSRSDAAHDAACVVVRTVTSGFPFAELEALARGVPVVATWTQVRAEVLGGAATLVEGGAVSELADAAIELVRNDAARSIGVAAGRARARDFSWPNRIGAFEAIYRRALAAG